MKGHRSGWYIRHSLIDGLHSVSHGEFIHYLLGDVVKVDLPCILPFHLRDLHHAVVLCLSQVVEQILLMDTRLDDGVIMVIAACIKIMTGLVNEFD